MLTTINKAFAVECDGTSIWMDTCGKTVQVKSITVETFEDDVNDYMHDYKHILVEHDSEWEIYTDKGFERAISNALGYDVTFTEQGMQERGRASMEN